MKQIIFTAMLLTCIVNASAQEKTKLQLSSIVFLFKAKYLNSTFSFTFVMVVQI